jgi:hypothetical protein
VLILGQGSNDRELSPLHGARDARGGIVHSCDIEPQVPPAFRPPQFARARPVDPRFARPRRDERHDRDPSRRGDPRIAR